ncbi:hypothetical protein C4J83_0616 [Pseudomonas sp. LBUM920]|nr:hypothetical protein C4J83_0616 [Pseudomonas sp. LBUM920]
MVKVLEGVSALSTLMGEQAARNAANARVKACSHLLDIVQTPHARHCQMKI